MPQVRVTMNLTGMPMSEAASGSSVTARMAMPCLVYLKNTNRTIPIAVTQARLIRWPWLMTVPKKWTGVASNVTGKAFVSRPQIHPETPCRM